MLIVKKDKRLLREAYFKLSEPLTLVNTTFRPVYLDATVVPSQPRLGAHLDTGLMDFAARKHLLLDRKHLLLDWDIAYHNSE